MKGVRQRRPRSQHSHADHEQRGRRSKAPAKVSSQRFLTYLVSSHRSWLQAIVAPLNTSGWPSSCCRDIGRLSRLCAPCACSRLRPLSCESCCIFRSLIDVQRRTGASVEKVSGAAGPASPRYPASGQAAGEPTADGVEGEKEGVVPTEASPNQRRVLRH